jgi:glycosyltransferase involved in cell wall biosynthesis
MAPLQPRVSAVIPVYNGERYLREAIQSVLAQDYPDLELIVVDDGSTDGSAAIARSFGERVRYHHQPNAGLSAAQNAGIEQARGRFIAYLDCDDLWMPDKIARQITVFDRDSAVDLVFGQVEQFYSPEPAAGQKREVPPVMAGFSTGTMLARIDVFERVGRFSSAFRIGEFLDWYARATDAGLISVMLDDVLLRRRIHGDNMGLRERDKRSDYLRVFKASLDRRRREGQNGS